MSLLTYEDARPWARAIRQRTSIRDKAGAMPPWYIEKNIGIQQLKHDPSLSDEEVAKIARWVDAGAPRGNPADMPPPLKWADDSVWSIGTPDLIVESPEILVKANSPDWWGELEPVKIPLDEDRYVAAIEMKEVNDIPSGDQGRETVGARYVFHHLIWSAAVLEEGGELPESQGLGLWPVHEVGRNADVFDPRAGRELKANSSIIFESTHLHSNGRDTKARLRFGFKLHPKGYKPDYRSTLRALGNGLDIDIKPNEANQQLHAYLVLERPMKVVTFEPHLHAPGARMCLEYIWGINIQTLSCSGYDHNWVRQDQVRGRLRAAPAEGHDPPHYRLHGQHREEQEHPRPAQLAGIGQPVHRQHVHRPRSERLPHRGAVPGRDGQAPREAQDEEERLLHRLPAVRRAAAAEDDDDGAETAAAGLSKAEGKRQQHEGHEGRDEGHEGVTGFVIFVPPSWPSCLRFRPRSCDGVSAMTRRMWAAVAVLGLAATMTVVTGAQTPSYQKGQSVSPAFEGWEQNDDGSFNMLFGYMNRNWEEELDLPVGPNNDITPGQPDQGQPTHFYPRRNRFVFKVKVPKDWGNKELVWTLTAYGKTEKAFATLRPDSFVDNLVQASEQGALGAGVSSPAVRKNTAPTLKVDSGPDARREGGRGGAAQRVGARRWRAAAALRARLAEREVLRSTGPGRAPLAAGARRLDRWQPDGAARVMGRVSRPQQGDLHARADEGLGGYPRRRQLAVGPSLGRAEDPGGRPHRYDGGVP